MKLSEKIQYLRKESGLMLGIPDDQMKWSE